MFCIEQLLCFRRYPQRTYDRPYDRPADSNQIAQSANEKPAAPTSSNQSGDSIPAGGTADGQIARRSNYPDQFSQQR